MNKKNIIDVAVPDDERVNLKEIEKIENYSELRREVKKIWQLKEVRVIPIVIGSLGTISNNFEHLKAGWKNSTRKVASKIH